MLVFYAALSRVLGILNLGIGATMSCTKLSPWDDLCDLEIGPLEQIAKEGQLMVYKHRGFWACMDTLRDMESLNKIWNEGKA